MNYQTALDNIFAYGSVPDGYFGGRSNCAFSLVHEVMVAVHSFGCYRLGLSAINDTEALWLLDNHPSFKDCRIHAAVQDWDDKTLESYPIQKR